MFKNILSKQQEELLPLLKFFSKDFYLAGGTAIASHLLHRHSIDFDLFTDKEFDNGILRREILKFGKIDQVLIDKKDEYTIVVKGVKLTFLLYDFPIKHNCKIDKVITTPTLLTLSAMKAYALGRRAKWKDYVDLYFVLKNKYSVVGIAREARKIFDTEFNEKNFRVQLSYFKDIDYTEKVDYLPGFEASDKEIKEYLINNSV